MGALVSLLIGVAGATGCETTTLPPARDGGADHGAVDGSSVDGAGLDVPQKIDVVSVDVVAVDVVAVDVVQDDVSQDVRSVLVPGCPAGNACDQDGDGVQGTACGGNDCDDRDCRRYPGRAEACDAEGHDEDCDPCTVAGSIDGDRDRDGFASGLCTNPWISAERAAGCDPGRIATRPDSQTTAGRDCNDDLDMRGGSQHPALPEVCDNHLDDDCDGRVDYAQRLFEDRDNDGRGDPATMSSGMCRPGWVTNNEDCDDRQSLTYQGAREMCDGLDNDCSLPGAMAGGTDLAEDRDGDLHSRPSAACLGQGEPGAVGSAFAKDDCNDDSPTVHRGAVEICGNGIDEDCDGTVDNLRQQVCRDADRDGRGNAATLRAVALCDIPPGEVPEARCDDCDDGDRDRFPGNREACDRVDNDCSTPRNPTATEEDQDEDGFSALSATCVAAGEPGAGERSFPRTDCDDTNRSVHPGAQEVCDRIDSDCSNRGAPATDEDADNDGHSPLAATCRGRGEAGAPSTAFEKNDCDEARPAVFGGQPASVDLNTCDGIDNDCDPFTSELTLRSGCGERGYCLAGGRCGRGPAVLQIDAGNNNTCARLANGTVRCWGFGETGELGDGRRENGAVPVTPAGLSNVIGLASGAAHTCALVSNGTVSCWGWNLHGQIGDGLSVVRATPNTVPRLDHVVGLSSGEEHNCVLRREGDVACWGYNSYGQLGNGATITSLSPVAVSDLGDVIEVVAGNQHTCALLRGGAVRCWGNNNHGQLGDGSTQDRSTPTVIPALEGFALLRLGGSYNAPVGRTCGASASGTLLCWGDNATGALGDGSTADRLVPTPVRGLGAVLGVDLGAGHTCAWTRERMPFCWGASDRGQLGSAPGGDSSVPVAVADVSSVQQMASGSRHTCSLSTDGLVQCWGNNDGGQLGRDGVVEGPPAPVGPLVGAVQVVGGGCALMGDGSVRCWGPNQYGNLGDLSTVFSRRLPGVVPGLRGVTAIANTSEATCALLRDATLMCWGRIFIGGSAGDHGTGYEAYWSTPVTIPGLSDVAQVALGTGNSAPHTCVRRRDGTVVCWGAVERGRMAEIPLSGRAVQVTLKGDGAFALIEDGSVQSWSMAGFGRPEETAMMPRVVPSTVAGLGRTLAVSGFCALGEDRRVRCLGASGPAVIRGIEDATGLSATGDCSCAVHGGGNVTCWGCTGSYVIDPSWDPTAPQPVRGLTDVVEVSSSEVNQVCARTRDHSVYCWGRIFDGSYSGVWVPEPSLFYDL